jgi:hypothetical protein
MIRRFRLGGSRPGDASAFKGEIIATVNAYVQRHPDIEWSAALQALADVRSSVETSVSGPKGG